MTLDPARNLVVALTAQNENQALEMGSSSMSHSFVARGYQHLIIDLFRPDGGQRLIAALKSGQVAFVYAFAGVGSQLALDNGVNLWSASETPFICLWYDHPCYNYLQHIVDSPFVAHCYHVRDHLDARDQYLPASSSRSALLTPLAGISELARPHPVATRLPKILFAKTARRADLIAEDWKRHSSLIQETIWAAVENTKMDRNLDITGFARSRLINHGFEPSNIALLMGVVHEVDDYIRAWRSERLVRALLPHDATIIGHGWEYLDRETRKAELRPPVSAHKYYDLVLQHRVVANSSPVWREGVHERVYIAMSFGSIILTDNSIKSLSLFGDAPNYVGFEWSDNVQDAIGMALKRSQDDQTDYFATAEKILNERIMNVTEDYIFQIEKVVLRVMGATS